MKYITVLADGMADLPLDELDGRTPLEAADVPNINGISGSSLTGIAYTIPEGMEPGSDVANLSVLGYDPGSYYAGRSGIEAAGMGLQLGQDDIALRTNLLTLRYGNSYESSVMIDHGADDITSDEAFILLSAIRDQFADDNISFFNGTSYRHLMVLSGQKNTFRLTPPHDILNKTIYTYLPKGKGSKLLKDMMKKSYDILSGHYVNMSRINRGLNPANSMWFWGAGAKTSIPSFRSYYGKEGGVISAVNLVKGIGRLSGMEVIEVEGADGTINTNYKGKVQACLTGLKRGLDFIYLHIEAPDECGHKGDLKEKIRSIELIDRMVIGPLLESAGETGRFRLMLLSDHPTPVSLRTHTSGPVPFMIYDSGQVYKGPGIFCEKSAASSGLVFKDGCELLPFFLSDK